MNEYVAKSSFLVTFRNGRALRASIETDVTVTVSHPPNRIANFYVALMKTAARSAAKKIYVATNENSRAQHGEKIYVPLIKTAARSAAK